MRNKAGVLSVTTWQQQVGLDPKHEAANFEAEVRRKGGDGRGNVDESIEPCECEGEVSETKRKATKYTGDTPDKKGHHHCFVDGKPAHCLDTDNDASSGTHSADATSGTGSTSQDTNAGDVKGDSGPGHNAAGKKSAPSPPTDPNRVLTRRDLHPPRLRPRKYGPEAGEVPPAHWGKHIQDETGVAAPVDMENPHGHHIKQKKGRGSQVKWVELATNILEFYDISWFRGTGPEGNLIHAPNVAGQHTTEAAKKLYDQLQLVHERNIEIGLTWKKGRQQIAKQLQDAGKRMKKLKF
jgi:hypothetical protein